MCIYIYMSTTFEHCMMMTCGYTTCRFAGLVAVGLGNASVQLFRAQVEIWSRPSRSVGSKLCYGRYMEPLVADRTRNSWRYYGDTTMDLIWSNMFWPRWKSSRMNKKNAMRAAPPLARILCRKSPTRWHWLWRCGALFLLSPLAWSTVGNLRILQHLGGSINWGTPSHHPFW